MLMLIVLWFIQLYGCTYMYIQYSLVPLAKLSCVAIYLVVSCWRIIIMLVRPVSQFHMVTGVGWL